MSEAARLYTPELLARTVTLAQYPLSDSLPLTGHARSQSCGSTLTIGLALESDGRIAAVGMRAQACAVGQASAAIFAQSAPGRTAADIAASLQAMRRWVREDGPMPNWPGLDLIEPARAFPGRHGAILLAWEAASEALSQAGSPR